MDYFIEKFLNFILFLFLGKNQKKLKTGENFFFHLNYSPKFFFIFFYVIL
jgi:hypothetical protein